MPRQRSPNRDEAQKIYIKKRGEIALTEIARQLNETDGTVRGWKAKDRWDDILNGTLQKKNKKRSKGSERSEKTAPEKSSINVADNVSKNSLDGEGGSIEAKTNTPHPQARFGNKNAYGNKGGKGGPLKNKFALRTGEYETIFFNENILDMDEMALLDIEVCKYNEQSRLVKSLRIREMRMYARIAALKNTPGGMVFDSVTKNKSTTTTGAARKCGRVATFDAVKCTEQYNKHDAEGEVIPGSSNKVTEDSSSHVAVPVLAEIMKIEDALTRVQGRLQRAIEVWHKMELDDSKLAIDQDKLDFYRMRITGQIDLDELVDDDDFEGDIDDAL